MQVSPAKRQEENWKGRYSKGLKNQNGKYLEKLCESNNLETQVIFPYSKLSETYFLWKYK